MTTLQSPPPPAPAPLAAAAALDPRMLAIASVSSLLGGALGAALGGSVAMTFVGMAVAPWLSALVEHPGPHRRRRVALVALLALLIYGCRKAIAAIRSRPARTTSADHEARQLGRVALTATTAIAVAVVALTAGELAVGSALAGDRDTTFFGGGDGRAPAAPTLRVPGRVAVTTPDPDGRRVTYNVTAADAAGTPLTPACTPASGTVFELGDTAVRCTVTDAAGAQASAGFTVAVRRGRATGPADRRPPTLSVPADLTREARSDDGLVVSYLASASDDRDGPLTPTCRPTSGTRFPLGRTRVMCSATDAAGHTQRAAFTVSIVRAGGAGADTTPPRVVVGADISRAASGPDGRAVPFEASASDDRDGTLEAVCDPPPGSVFAIGTRGVRCTATNRAGLSATESFTVEVTDGPPVLRVGPTLVVAATSVKGARVTIDATATDAVDGTLSPACDPPSGSRFAIGEHTVTCTARDSAGATDTATVVLTVTEPPDTTPPALRGPREVTKASLDGEPVAVTFGVSAYDRRDGTVSVRCDPRSGSLFAVGERTVRCTARDSAGNAATHDVRVVVYRSPD